MKKDKSIFVDYFVGKYNKTVEIGDRVQIGNIDMAVYQILKIPCSYSVGHNDVIHYEICELTGFTDKGTHQTIKLINDDPYVDESDKEGCFYFEDLNIYHLSSVYIKDLEKDLYKIKKEMESYMVNMYTNIVCSALCNNFLYIGPSNDLISNILLGKSSVMKNKLDNNKIASLILYSVLDKELVLKNISDLLGLNEKYSNSKDFEQDVNILIGCTLWEKQYNFDIDMGDLEKTRENFYNILPKASKFFADAQGFFMKMKYKS